MARKLITLPLRSTRLLTRAAGEVAIRALAISGRAIQVVSSARAGDAADIGAQPASAPKRRAEPVVAAVSGGGVVPTPVARPAAPEPEPAPPPEVREPAHVSEEPVLVRESAEPGAEEGAGARVTVIEPWTGYGHMNARDVIDRVRTASMAELAAMRLYEARHRARRTVLAAVDRQLKLAATGRPA